MNRGSSIVTTDDIPGLCFAPQRIAIFQPCRRIGGLRRTGWMLGCSRRRRGWKGPHRASGRAAIRRRAAGRIGSQGGLGGSTSIVRVYQLIVSPIRSGSQLITRKKELETRTAGQPTTGNIRVHRVTGAAAVRQRTGNRCATGAAAPGTFGSGGSISQGN